MLKLHPAPSAAPEKKSPPFFSNLPLKVKVLSSPPLFENLVGGSTPPSPSRKEGGVHTMLPLYNGLVRDAKKSHSHRHVF